MSLGGTTLVAHLTPGRTRGCTTWTMRAADGTQTFNVVFACSYRAPGNVTSEIEAEFIRTFKTLRTLPCDVPLGDHPAQYNMAAKHARLTRRREPVCRCGQLLGGSRDRGGDVPGTAGDTTERGAMKKASDERAEVHAKRRAYFASFRH